MNRVRLSVQSLESRIIPVTGLDPSYGNGGYTLANRGFGEEGYACIVDATGRVYIGGYTSTATDTDATLIRYHSDGAVDTSFGDMGQTITEIYPGTNYFDAILAIRIDHLGRILAAGYTYNGTINQGFVQRYQPDGSLDTTFGTNGFVLINANMTQTTGGFELSIDSQGRIVTGLQTFNGTDWDFAVARLLGNGSFDTSFSTDGVTSFNIQGNDFLRGLAIDADDRIVVAGSASTPANQMAFARLTEAGDLDPTFDADGVRIVPFTSGTVGDVLIDSLGRIVAGGTTNTGTGDDFGVVRLLPTGALDTTFDSDGFATTNFLNNDQIQKITFDSEERIITVGSRGNSPTRDYAMARFNTDGSLDSTFGVGGKTVTAIQNDEVAYAVAIDPFGRIYVNGSTNNGSNYDMGLVRYDANGNIDRTFRAPGYTSTPIGPSEDLIQSSAIDSQGRLVVGGSASNGSSYDFAVARYTPQGILDTTFGIGGKITFDFGLGVTNEELFSLKIDSQGRIVVGGYAGADMAVARLTPNGQLDTTFNSTGKRLIDFTYTNEIGLDLEIDAFDRIWVAGFANSVSTVRYNAVARVLPDGRLDPSFGGDGTQLYTILTDSRCNSIELDPLGQAFIGGIYYNGSDWNAFITKLTSTGNIDTSWATNGRFEVNIGNADVTAMEYQEQYGQFQMVGTTGDGRIQRVTYSPSSGSVFAGADNYSFVASGFAFSGYVGSTTMNGGLAFIARGYNGSSYGYLVVGGSYATFVNFGSAPASSHATISVDSNNRVLFGAGVSSDFTVGRVLPFSSIFGSGSRSTLTIDRSEPTAILPEATMTAQGLLARVDVVLTGYVPGEDVLEAPLLLPGITTSTYVDSNGWLILRLQGNASADAYQQMTRAITYRNTASQVTNQPRTVSASLVRTDSSAGSIPQRSIVLSQAPTLSGVPGSITLDESTPLSFSPTATNPDAGDQLVFSLINGPTGATIDPQTGAFSWTPSEDQGSQSYSFVVRVTDGLSRVDSPITVTVREKNVAPVLASVPSSMTLVQGESASFTAIATDSDLIAGLGNALTYSLIGAPLGAFIDPDTGAFTWAPTPGTLPGSYTFQVRVVDDGQPALFDKESITIDYAVATIVGGDLRIGGTAGNDTIVLVRNALTSLIDVSFNGLLLDSFAPSAITGKIVVRGNDGNDKISVGATVTTPTELFGGNGNDSLTGGGGADTVHGGSGNDTVTGGKGNDRYVFANNWGSDRVVELTGSPNGLDTLDFAAVTTALTTTFGVKSVSGGSTVTHTGNVIESFVGGSAVDTFFTPSGTNRWTVQGPNFGVLNTTINYSSFENLTGGTGADTFTFLDGVTLLGSLSGGTGTNALNLGAFSTDVTVNLRSNSASTVLGFVSGIASVVGGAGNDLLVGDNLRNTLLGGLGRDVLIGGGGADSISGGDGDDLLIGGSTLHDLVPGNLNAIRNEWTSNDSYANRADHLAGVVGGGLNGSVVINASTVSNDSVRDTLVGGANDDLFITNLLDFVGDRLSVERVTAL